MCDICKEEFDNSKIKANHVRWKHKYKGTSGFTEKGRLKQSLNAHKLNEKKFGKKTTKEKECPWCKKKFKIETRKNNKKEKKCCSLTCAKKYSSSFYTKADEATCQKISKAVKLKWKDDEYRSKCIKNLGKNKYFTSKGELAFRDFFKTQR